MLACASVRRSVAHRPVRLPSLTIPTASPVTYGQEGAPVPTKEEPLADVSQQREGSSPNFPILVRATNGKAGDDRKAGKKAKLSTVVQLDALDAFYARYAEICKAGMGALKPRDRSKRKTKGKKKKTAGAGA